MAKINNTTKMRFFQEPKFALGDKGLPDKRTISNRYYYIDKSVLSHNNNYDSTMTLQDNLLELTNYITNENYQNSFTFEDSCIKSTDEDIYSRIDNKENASKLDYMQLDTFALLN